MQSISDRSLLLEQFGLRVELIGDDDALRVTPSSRITPAARDYIVANKAALRDRLLGETTFTTVGDIAAGIVTAMAALQPTPAPALPADLMERVNLICRLEQWLAADRAEWLGILRQQIERDGAPVRELVACLDAHLAKHHPDAGLPDGLHDCMSCDHWRGEATVPNGQQQLRTLVNPASTYRGNKVIGGCAQHYRPHRASNDPNQSAYLHWRFAGPCGWKPKQEENPS